MALTSTRFLQHSQTDAASFKIIVEKLNICSSVTTQGKGTSEIQQDQHAQKCAAASASPTRM